MANSGAEMGLDKKQGGGRRAEERLRRATGEGLWVLRGRLFALGCDFGPWSTRCVGGRGTPLTAPYRGERRPWIYTSERMLESPPRVSESLTGGSQLHDESVLHNSF